MLDGIFCSYLSLLFLPVESDQVGVCRRSAELPNHRRDLPPVVGAMVDEMLERLPQHVAHRFAFDV